MDRFMNTHKYSANVVKSHPIICTYNAFKRQHVTKVEEGVVYERAVFLVDDHTPPGFLKFMELFKDEDVDKPLPDYVVDQIAEAISSINIYPSPLKMTVQGDNYVLLVKYTNTGIPDNQPPTTVQLEYTFHKDIKQFEGYFCENLAKNPKLPEYEVVHESPTEDGQADVSSFLRVVYHHPDNKVSSLDVKITVGNVKSILSIVSSIDHFSNNLENIIPNMSLVQAVLRRIFPTIAHYIKYIICQIIKDAEIDFYQNLTLTSLNWYQAENFQHFHAKYILYCFKVGETRPFNDNKLMDSDILKAMNTLIAKYPFFMPDEKCAHSKECLITLWERYFKKKLTPKIAQTMKLSDIAINNLAKFYNLDSVKYANVFKLFPSIRFPTALKDLERRLGALRKMKRGPVGNNAITMEDVVFYNRMTSTIPDVKWRLYLLRGTLGEPVFEMGEDIIKRKEKGTPPTTTIEEVNYIDIANNNQPLSLYELMEEITLTGDLVHLNPKNLESRFKNYQFSQDYKSVPTKLDCLAVRFANVYKKDGYEVPNIPQDFYHRLILSQDDDEDGSDSNFLCVICLKKKKNHSFPACCHLCVCELCSFHVLKCPLCYRVGNPRKMYF